MADSLPEPTPENGYEIVGQGGDYRFILYSNAGIVQNDTTLPDKTTRHTRPMFDILVTAEKQSPFSRAAQNETAKELYGMGLFAPENSIPALACLDMMDFEGKDKVVQEIQQNSLFMQQFEAAMQMIQQQAMVDPAFGMMAMQQGLVDPDAMMQAQSQMSGPQPGTPEQRVSSTGNSYADKIRERSANAANPM